MSADFTDSAATPPTIVRERVGRRNTSFALGIAVLVLAIATPIVRNDTLDASTQIAMAALLVVALGTSGLWAYVVRHPTSLIIGDDEIRTDPPGANPELRCITRPFDGLRLAKEGSVRSKTLVLSSLTGQGRIPLYFMDRQAIVDACYAHGWTFGEPEQVTSSPE